MFRAVRNRDAQSARGRRRAGKGDVAAIYTRVSDPDEEKNGDSHERQQMDSRDMAAKLDYDQVEMFVDNFSGRYLHERPGLTKLRAAVRSGRIGVVIVGKLDRFSRNTAQRAIIVQEFRQHGVEYVSATEEISDSPEGRFLENMLSNVAEFEVERTLERSQGSLSLIRARGEPICAGLARYGYRYNTLLRVRDIIEEEAEVVRRIFAWYLAGDSSIAIAARLEGLRIPCPAVARKIKLKGERTPKWQSSTVRAILRDASYAGAPMTSGKKRCTGAVDASGNGKTERTDPSQWWQTRDGTPAIVDPDDFARVQSLVRSGAGTRKTRNGDRPYLLRGMVKCAVCGRTMSPEPHMGAGGKTYAYFVCTSVKVGKRCGSKGTPVAWLDAIVWPAVVAHVTDRGVIEGRLAAVAREHRSEDLDRDRGLHERATEETRAELRRLLARLAKTDDPELGAAIEELLVASRASLQAHLAEIAQIDQKLTVIRNKEAVLESWWRTCQGVRDVIAGDLGFDEKRLLLQALDVRVVANKRDLRVAFGIPMADGELLVVTGCSPGRASDNDQLRMRFEFKLTG